VHRANGVFWGLFILVRGKENSRKSISTILHSYGPIGLESRASYPLCWPGPPQDVGVVRRYAVGWISEAPRSRHLDKAYFLL
jgi:hypothetical protein